MSTVGSTGRNPPPGHPDRGGPVTFGPTNRARPKKTMSGMRRLPKSPSGSRAKILISSHVSFSSDLSAIVIHSLLPPLRGSVTNGMPSQFQKHILEVRLFASELRDPDPVLRDAVNDIGHEILASASQRKPASVLLHRLEAGDRGEPGPRIGIARRQHDRRVGTVPPHQSLGRADVDDAPALDDRDAVAETLGFFHQMGGEQDGLSPLADAAHHVPDRATGLRIETGGEF